MNLNANILIALDNITDYCYLIMLFKKIYVRHVSNLRPAG